MEIREAIEQFRSAAIEKGPGAESAARDRALYASMVEAWGALEQQGVEGRAAFSALLLDDSPDVRIWVASQLLALGDERGAFVLKAEAAVGGLRSVVAETVLREWEAGHLEPPFGKPPWPFL